MPLPPWGGGHTHETDPSRNGWRCRPVGDNGVLLLAKKGDVVAASCRKMSDGWDVGLYWNSPSDVAAYLRGETKFCSEGYTIEATYRKVADVPGWGLEVIDLLREERKILKEMS